MPSPDGEAPPLDSFFFNACRQLRITWREIEPSVWELELPTKIQPYFRADKLRASFDREACLLDPNLRLIALGATLVQRLLDALRHEPLQVCRGRAANLLLTATQAASRCVEAGITRSADSALVEERRCLRFTFKVTYRREFVAEKVVSLMYDLSTGVAELSGLLPDDPVQFEPASRDSVEPPAVTAAYVACCEALERRIWQEALDHSNDLADLLEAEKRRVNDFYDLLESENEGALGQVSRFSDPTSGLQQLKRERTQLLAEQERRFSLTSEVELITAAFMVVPTVQLNFGSFVVSVNPLADHPLLPPCQACGRRPERVCLDETDRMLCIACAQLLGVTPSERSRTTVGSSAETG